MYSSKTLDAQTVESIRRDLEELRAWDNYERSTAPNREAAKLVLQRYLDHGLLA